jgi:adenosylcobinamide-GDP ribazoletransferase
LFYTCLPLPRAWPTAFNSLARAAPLVGLFIGLQLSVADWGLGMLGMTGSLRATLVVLLGLWITGGLHLDGAMDTADGLAVPDPQRRLTVMADSRSGAFGVMVAIAILLLKITALAALPQDRWFALLMAAGWGRWGQQWAIARYPYLKSEGKGAFHKQAIRSAWDTLPGGSLLVGLSLLSLGLGGIPVRTAISATVWGMGLALILPAWFNHRLGGHTGDTYGAVVEWVEAGVLVGMTVL